MYIDTHTHLYDEQFSEDRTAVIQRALDAGVQQMLLPNCDDTTIAPMLELARQYPKICLPMMGLHPCYVAEDYGEVLQRMHSLLTKGSGEYVAIGEIGLDYYWSQDFIAQQQDAFSQQIEWALALDLPIAIHTRAATQEAIRIVASHQNGRLRGVFHCFGGSLEEARQIMDLGFYLGIGGVATFKNSSLKDDLPKIGLENLILETDAPYLAPTPYRGKRCESSYIPLIADRVATLLQMPVAAVAAHTTLNAQRLFGL